MTLLRAAALAYVQRFGWHVFPLRPRGKEPLTEHGVHDATTDATQVLQWWQRWPNANIGLACGIDFLVIDIDPRNDGDMAMRSIERVYGDLPHTPRCITGSDGYHVYLQPAPQGIQLRKALTDGIDVQGRGKYVVAPPSIHPDTRGRYRWEIDYHPATIPIATVPQWLANLIVAPDLPDRGAVVGGAGEAFLGRLFATAGLSGRETRDGRLPVCCPWLDSHSDARGDGRDTSTVILPPTEERPLGWFHCSHGHCEGRRQGDVFDWITSKITPAQGRQIAKSMPQSLALALRVMGKAT